MIATERVTSDDRELLANLRRDRVRQKRPSQLAERATLVAALAPSAAELQESRAMAAEVEKASGEVTRLDRELEQARDRLSRALSRRDGRSTSDVYAREGSRRRLEALAHPAIGATIQTLIRVDFSACALPIEVLGVEQVDEPADAPEARRWWEVLRMRRHAEVRLSTPANTAFLEAVRAARMKAEQLTYEALEDVEALGRLRAILDQLLKMRLPTMRGMQIIEELLGRFRAKLDGDPFTVWAAVTEDPR